MLLESIWGQYLSLFPGMATTAAAHDIPVPCFAPPPPGHVWEKNSPGRDSFLGGFGHKQPKHLFLLFFLFLSAFPLFILKPPPSSQVQLMLFVGSQDSWQPNLLPARFSVGLLDSLFFSPSSLSPSLISSSCVALVLP